MKTGEVTNEKHMGKVIKIHIIDANWITIIEIITINQMKKSTMTNAGKATTIIITVLVANSFKAWQSILNVHALLTSLSTCFIGYIATSAFICPKLLLFIVSCISIMSYAILLDIAFLPTFFTALITVLCLEF